MYVIGGGNNNTGYVLPIQSGAKRRLVERCDTFQYIPFLENLEWFLDNKEIYKEVGVFVNLRWH